MLLLSLRSGAVPLNCYFGEALSTRQGGVQQRGGFVIDLGDGEGLVHPLARRLAALRVRWDLDGVFKLLHQNFVLVVLLPDVAHAVRRQRTLGDGTLLRALNGTISRGWHEISSFSCCMILTTTLLPSGY